MTTHFLQNAVAAVVVAELAVVFAALAADRRLQLLLLWSQHPETRVVGLCGTRAVE